MELPPVPEGHIRLFYIRVTIASPGVYPTDDRCIHFSDLTLGHAPYNVMGAPHYDWVVGNPRKLVMMQVMYDLDITPTHWDPR